jgi:hypothetical protein
MMSLSLYSEDINESVEISRGLYRELAESEFSKIGISKPTKLTVDGEEFELQLVALTPDVRIKMLVFLARRIFEKSTDALCGGNDDTLEDDDSSDRSSGLKSMTELIEFIGDNIINGSNDKPEEDDFEALYNDLRSLFELVELVGDNKYDYIAKF